MVPLVRWKSTARFVYLLEKIQTDTGWWALCEWMEENPSALRYGDALVEVLACIHEDDIERTRGTDTSMVPVRDVRRATPPTGPLGPGRP